MILMIRKVYFKLWFWHEFSNGSAKLKQYLVLVGISFLVFSLMALCYKEGKDDGTIIGMTYGFDLGYALKKPPVIIVVPRPEKMLEPRQPDEDSVLWRI